MYFMPHQLTYAYRYSFMADITLMTVAVSSVVEISEYVDTKFLEYFVQNRCWTTVSLKLFLSESGKLCAHENAGSCLELDSG